MHDKLGLLLIYTLAVALAALLWPASLLAACANPVFINEFHYDNAGTDTGEFIEVAGPAGTDLTGWTLVLYRGTGTTYGTPVVLSGVIDDEGNGYGARSFVASLQNGPDGLALVDAMGSVRQLLSYEGTLTATSGPAAGQTSVNVGVVEGTATPVGSSLQLLGAGDCADAFAWSGPAPASPDAINNGQAFSTVPQVIATSPTAGAYEVAIDATITVTFSEAIVIANSVQIDCTQSGIQTVTPILAPPRTIQLPHADFSGGELCTVMIPADGVTDLDDAPDPLPAAYSWQFEVGFPPANWATLFISTEEAQSRTVVDAQDDAWRSAAQTLQSCPTFATGILQEATNVQCGDNIGDCALPSILPSGLVISYTLRNMDGRTLGSDDGWATGQMDGCSASSVSLQDGAPRPTGLPGCYYNDAANLRGNNDNPNGVLFNFSEPLTAFGAWFGDLEGKPYGNTYYHDGSDGGTGVGGAQAYMRLFFEDGTMQEAPIEPSLAPSAPWLAANAPPPASPLDSGGDVGYCGGHNSTTDAVGCGNKTTRWVGFVANQPANRVTRMLVVLGDDDHSGAGPSDGPNVTCAGGDARACNGGNEYLSFIGPTACILPDLTIAKSAETEIVRAGDVITYTLTYSSEIAGIATGPITITDALPPGLELLTTVSSEPPALQIDGGPAWRIDQLSAGVTGEIVFTARVAATLTGWITNTATIYTPGDSNAENDQATVATFIAAPQITLRKLLNGQEITTSPGPELDQGAAIVWSYGITNTGNVSLANLSLNDDQLPALACLEGALPALLLPGATFTCTVQDNAQLGDYTNLATASGVPLIGPSNPVTATAASYYQGIGYGTITIVATALPQHTQPFTFTVNNTSAFTLVDQPGGGGQNVYALDQIRAGESYTISAEAAAGWSLTEIVCTGEEASVTQIGSTGGFDPGDNTATIQLAAGEEITCTFTYSGALPLLTLVKTVVNDHGGNAQAGDFIPQIDGQAVTWNSPIALAVGQHLVTETTFTGYLPSVWGGDCAASGAITLAIGDEKRCTITNDDQPALLRIQTSVTNDHGGSATANDFPLWLNGQPIASNAELSLSAGSYILTTTVNGAYTYSISGLCADDGGFVLTLAEEQECIVVIDDLPAGLVVQVEVNNDDGGTATLDAVTLGVNDQPVATGVTVTLNAGPVAVSAEPLAGYTTTFAGDCSATGAARLVNGATAYCYVRFDDQPTTLTIQPTVRNDDGGTALLTDFPLLLNGTPATGSATISLTPGSYTVAVITQTGYQLVFADDCTEAGVVTLEPGEQKICTLTLDDIAPTLFIDRVVVNDSGGAATVADFPLNLNGHPVVGGTAQPLAAGEYNITVTLPAGYTVTFAADCGLAGRLQLALADRQRCTLYFDDIFATLGDQVWLDQDGDGQQGAGEPGITGVMVELYDSTGAAIATAMSDETGSYRFSQLLPGRYRLAFSLPPGYGWTSYATGDGAADSNVDPAHPDTLWVELGPGEQNLTVDAGLVPQTSIVGRVWYDLDRDDQQSEAEPGLAGVVATLLAADGQVVSTTTTLTNGQYSFTGLPPGDYAVVFAPPRDFGFTLQDVGSDLHDSDADPRSGRTMLIRLSAGAGPQQLDAGLFTAPELHFQKSVGQQVVWLEPGASQVVTYTLRFRNFGLVTATGVAIEEQLSPGGIFVAAASTAGWECNPDDNRCRYPVGKLPAGAEGAVVFAILLGEGSGPVENIAYLYADGLLVGEGSATVTLEASATLEVLHPTALEEEIEPGVGNHRIFLPWVMQ